MTTEAGKHAIGTLKVGQKVLAYNPKTHKMEEEPIVQVWKHTDDDVVDLTLTVQTHAPHSTVAHSKSEVVHTNKKHPFLTVEQGFLPVASVKVGMHVKRADGRVGIVTVWKRVPGITMMYNLEVAQDHTFTVGDGQWIVHNCGGYSPDDLSSAASQPSSKQGGYTKAGNALAKHGQARPDSAKWVSYMPSELKPKAEQFNKMGQAFVDDLVNNPNTIWKVGGDHIKGYESIEEGSRGAAWWIKEVLEFSGFL